MITVIGELNEENISSKRPFAHAGILSFSLTESDSVSSSSSSPLLGLGYCLEFVGDIAILTYQNTGTAREDAENSVNEFTLTGIFGISMVRTIQNVSCYL